MNTPLWQGLARPLLAAWLMLAGNLYGADYYYNLSMPAASGYMDAVWLPGGVAPTAGNFYEVQAGGTVNSPTNLGGTVAFPAPMQLTSTSSKMKALRAPGLTGTMTLGFPSGLILAAGKVESWDTNITLSGSIVVSSNSSLGAGTPIKPVGLAISAGIQGRANLTLSGAAANTQPYDILSAANDYRGTWYVQNASLKGTGNGSLGQSSVVITNTSSSITSRLDVAYNLRTPGSLTFGRGTNCEMNLHSDCVFGSVVISNKVLAAGTYTYATLNTTYPRTFPAGGSGSLTVLPAPANLVATPGNNQVGLSWSAVAAASSYIVYRGPAALGPFTQLATPAGTTYTDATAVNGTTYYYVVSAVSAGAVESGYYEAVSATPAAPPSAPTGLAAANGDGQVTLSWNAVASATSYIIKRSATSGSGYVNLWTNTAPDTLYVDTGLANGSTWYYVVSAVNAGGPSPNSTEVVGQPNSAPTGLVAIGGQPLPSQVFLSWDALLGASSYKVKRSSTPSGPYTIIAPAHGTTTYTDTTAPAGQISYYVVSAMVGVTESANSAEVNALTAPSVPTGLSASAPNPTNVVLSWSSANAPALTTFKIERSLDGGVTFVPVGTVIGVNSYTNVSLNPSTTYFYQVRASNTTGESGNTAPVSATTPGVALYFNFADNTAPDFNLPSPPRTYFTDRGAANANKPNGYRYGWDVDLSGSGVYRHNPASPDLRYDTHMPMYAAGGKRSWQVTVPPGTYRMRTVVGDPDVGADLLQQLTFKDVTLDAATISPATRWVEQTNTFSTADGIISFGVSAQAVSNRLCFVDLETVAGSAPYIVSGSGRYGHQILLVFSDRMRSGPVTDVSHYTVASSFGPNLVVSNASLLDGRTVLLNTSHLVQGDVITVTLSGGLTAVVTNLVVADGTSITFVNDAAPINLGSLIAEFWRDTATEPNLISQLTNDARYIANLPTSVTNITTNGWQSTGNSWEHYGMRALGFFIPPSNGLYRFYLRSDDASQLWMNTNSVNSMDRDGRVLLAEEAGCCRSYPAVFSRDIALTGGQYYYMETLMEEGTGGDYFFVAVRESGDPSVPPDSEVMPSHYLASPMLDLVPELQLSDVTTKENRRVTFHFRGTPLPSYLAPLIQYQWYRDGSEIPGAAGGMSGFGDTYYTLPRVTMGDSGSTFECRFTGHGGFSYATRVATLTVEEDFDPPVVVSAGSLNGKEFGMIFDEPIDPFYVTPGQGLWWYVIDDIITQNPLGNVTNVVLRPDGQSIQLFLDTQLAPGTPFTLAGDIVGDLKQNAVWLPYAAGTILNPNAVNRDVTGIPGDPLNGIPGDPQVMGYAFVGGPENLIEVTAGGSTISGTNDAFHYVYETRGDNFAMQVRLTSLLMSNARAKAGLMFRESLDGNSRTYFVYATPTDPGGAALVEVLVRTNAGPPSATVRQVPMAEPCPDVWLKLTHDNGLFSSFYSSDGMNWTMLNQYTPDTPYVTLMSGLATTSHNNNPDGSTVAAYEGWQYPCLPQITRQPGPTPVVTGEGETVSFSGVQVSADCPPLYTYQWYKNGTALAGQTAASLTLNNVTGFDSGSYVLSVSRQGNPTFSTPCLLTVTNALGFVNGSLVCDIWRNIGGNPVANLTSDPRYPTTPDERRILTEFKFSFGDNTENYGARIYGYFRAPSNGVFRFYLRSDDNSQLWLNPNGIDPAGRVLIAEELGCCTPYTNHVSVGYPMVEGQYYYIEGLLKQGGVIEYIQVAFREAGDPSYPPGPAGAIMGGGTAEVIAGAFLARPVGDLPPPAQDVTVQIALVDPDTIKITWPVGSPPANVYYSDDAMVPRASWLPTGATVVTEPDGSFSCTITGVLANPQRFYCLRD